MFDIVRQPYSICMMLMRFIVILTQMSLEFVRYYVNLIGILQNFGIYKPFPNINFITVLLHDERYRHDDAATVTII